MSHANFLSSKSSGQQKIGFRATQSQDMLTRLRLTLHSETRCGPGSSKETHHDTACDLSATRHCMIACPTYVQSVPSELSTPTASLAHPSHPCTAYTIISCFKHVVSHLYLVVPSYILISTYINMYQPIPSINGCDIWVSSEASNKSFGAGEDFAHALVAHRNGIRIRTALAGDETAGRVEQSGSTGTK